MLSKYISLSVGLLISSQVLFAQVAALPRLEIKPTNAQGWIRLSTPGQTGMVYSIQASTNLSRWTAIGTTHGGIWDYPDFATDLFRERFYRFVSAFVTSEDDWKNQSQFPDDTFLSTPGGLSGPDFRWIKFAIPLNEPPRIFYQDSDKYAFHYDFATKRIDAFRGMTPSQFDQVALHTNRQEVLLGTLLYPPPPNNPEYCIQFVGLDAYPPEFIARYFELVRATVAGGSNVNAFYMPTFEQAGVAENNRAYFESKGIRLASADRWISGNDIYSQGWALGRLKFFPGNEINIAFTDGRLLPQDILLTEGVPAEIPVLAGVLTLTPSTPNSHVAILSKSFGLPFAYLSDPAARARVQALVGKDVLLRIDRFTQEVEVSELETNLPAAFREEILQLKLPPKLAIRAKEKYGARSASTDNLTPADGKFFGGKASNFGFLRRNIPNQSPKAIAFSFDLWDEFMDQTLPGGRTLRAEIESRLSGYTYPANVAALKTELAAIRSLITGTARFTDAQKQAIIEALGVFDPGKNIRFRSSTNVEDTEQFTGAGLYDSFSGCLADDLDADETGPCLCEPTEKSERGVFRAIQKVYASFYNDNAFIERLRHKVNEQTVGMALLVHHSAPDETELANGVATIVMQRNGSFDSDDGDLVTQKGAVSVTNPDGSAKPEIVQGYHNKFGAGGFLRQRSSLVPLGAYVLEWDQEYVELMNLFARIGDGYHAYFPGKAQFTLDFEYKKIDPGVLEVKQVREVPVIAATNTLPAFLIHETNDYVVFQGEAGDVFSNHRLKSFWRFHSQNVRLAGTNLTQSLFANLDADYLENKQVSHLSGSPANLQNASHSITGDYVIDHWTNGDRNFELRTLIRREVSATDSPVLTLADLSVEFSARYATPQAVLQYDFDGLKPVTVQEHSVVLAPRRALTSTSPLQQRTLSRSNLTVQTSFYWPAPPSKGIGEKTAPLIRWKETRIEGLTSQPIILRGEYSQTYRPGHHNFSEEFIFEPALEDGTSAELRNELQSANVQFIYAASSFGEPTIAILGLDGKFRFLP